MKIQEDPLNETKGNPFPEDPLCKLNLKETAEFVKSLPMSDATQSAQKRRERENGVIGNSMPRRIEAPSTPGRPVFSFSASRRSLPSKWDDAEKWLVGGGSCHESPAHHTFCKTKQMEPFGGSNSRGVRDIVYKQQQSQVFAEKFRVVDCQLRPSDASLEDHDRFNRVIVPSEMPLKGGSFSPLRTFGALSSYSCFVCLSIPSTHNVLSFLKFF